MKKLIFLLLLLPALTVFAPISNDSFENYFKAEEQSRLETFLFWERDRCINHLQFTPELLMEYLVRLQVKSPEIVFKQAVLETGWFRSELFKTNNNLFGMNHPVTRPSTSLFRGPKGFAVFNDWRESVKDYALWQGYKEQWHDLTNYYAFLKKIPYATDPSYISKLKNLNTKNYSVMTKKIFSTEKQLNLFQEYTFVAPKLHVEYPDLDATDILKCEMYVNDLNLLHEAKLIIDLPKRKSLIVKDGVPGFIQKRNDQVMVYYKDGTSENISQRMSLQRLFDHYGIVQVTEDNAEFNFNGVVNLVADGRSKQRV